MTDLDKVAELLRQHEARIAELVARPPVTAAVLTLAEAIAYTKHESDSAFYRWCDRYRVRAISHGRYSLRWLDRGLEKEAAAGRRLRPAA